MKKTHQKKAMKKLLSVMFKIGCVGFGGGTALIPVIEDEVVTERQLVDGDEFNKNVLVANITPGALPVEIASGIGRRVCGMPGMVLAATLMALPGTFLTVFLLSLIHRSGDAILRQILFASAGVTAYIIFMLISYAHGTYAECRKNKNAKSGMFFMLLVFVLTSEKALYQILGVAATPIFGVSIVHILILAFFIIFYTNGHFNRPRLAISGVIAVLYCLCVGKMQLIAGAWVPPLLQAIMLILAMYGVRKSINGKIPFSWHSLRKLLKELLCWVGFLALLSVPAMLLYPDLFVYLWRGLVSAVMSFGGGDAYLAVADGLFVSTGFIGYEDFYSKVVSVATALPGSILCKVLAGIGYILGYGLSASAWAGYAVALSGFACSVAASGATFSCVVYLYERFENLAIFQTIKRYIRPIVAGLLLSVSASMLYQNMSISTSEQWSALWMPALTVGLCLVNMRWRRSGRIRPFPAVLLSALIAVIVCNGLTIL